jgi:hypothetical protein
MKGAAIRIRAYMDVFTAGLALLFQLPQAGVEQNGKYYVKQTRDQYKWKTSNN